MPITHATVKAAGQRVFAVADWNANHQITSPFNIDHIAEATPGHGVVFDNDIDLGANDLYLDSGQKLDLGTNTITDGNMTGDWDFGAGDLTTTGLTKTDELEITAPTTSGSYKYVDSTGYLGFQAQGAGQNFIQRYFTKDGDGTDSMLWDLIVKGVPSDITTAGERMQFGKIAANGFFHIRTINNGAGTLRPINIYTGTASSQLVLNIDGSVSAQGDLKISSDNKGVVFGVGQDMDIYSDGTNGVITTTTALKIIGTTYLGDGGTTNYTEIASNGDLTFVGTAGLSHGDIYGMDETVTCTTQNTWYQATFDTSGPANNVTVSTANNDLTVIALGAYHVGLTICCHSAVAHNFEAMVKKNNGTVDVPATHLFQRTSVANQVENIAGTCNASFAHDDTIEIWVRCTDAAGIPFIMDHLDLNITQIGGT